MSEPQAKQPDVPEKTGHVAIESGDSSPVTFGAIITGIVHGDVKTVIELVQEYKPGPLEKFTALGVGLISVLLLVVIFFSAGGTLAEQRRPGGLLAGIYPYPTPPPTLTPTPPPPPTPTPLPPLPDGFNIGLAGFVPPDHSLSPEESDRLSRWFYETLRQTLDEQATNYIAPGSDWQRLNIPKAFRGPAEIGPVVGDTEERRAGNAAALVERHNLTMLVYGYIEQGEQGLALQPVFFVPESNRLFDYGREISGPSRLGRAVPLSPSFDAAGLAEANAPLLRRLIALSHIILGLEDFAVNRYREAQADFERALAVDTWPDNEGKEVVYLLQGAAALLETDRIRPPGSKQPALDEAQAAFERARAINDDYARSYLGLGTTHLAQAQMFTDCQRYSDDNVDNNELMAAQQAYSASLTAADRPPLAYVPEKAWYGLGRVHLTGLYAHKPGWSEETARAYFQRVLDSPAQSTPDMAWLVGNATAHLCMLDWLALRERVRQGESIPAAAWAAVESQCRTGISMLEPVPRSRPFLAENWWLVGIAAQQQEHLADACAAFKQAVDIAAANPDFYCDPEAWQTMYETLDCQ